MHTDPTTALRLSLLAEAAADRGDALIGICARARYQRAQILTERGRLAPALELIESARAAWCAAGDELAALGTDLGQMQVLDDLGRHADAVDVGERLLRDLDRRISLTGDPEAGRIHATAIENLGVAYGLTGQHEAALAAYAQAGREYQALGFGVETARPFANRGVELVALGRPREALADFAAATEIFAAAGDRLFAAQCQGDTAHAHRLLGEVVAALRLLEPARRTLAELGAGAEAARVEIALAETYLAAGLPAEARVVAEQATTTTVQAGMTHDTAAARFLIALADLARGQSQTAAAELNRAAALFASVDDRQALARVLLAQSEVADQGGHTDRALDLLAGAQEALERGGWLIPLTWAYLRQADLLDATADVTASLDRAAVLVTELRLPELSYQYELRASRLARRLGDTDEAIRRFERAIEVQQQSIGALPDHVLLTAFRAERLAANTELVDLLVELGRDLERASVLADQAKAQTLIGLQSDAIGPGTRLTHPDDDLARTFAELNANYLAMHQAIEPTKRSSLVERSEQLESRLNALRLRHLDADVLTLGVGGANHTPAPSARHPQLAYLVSGLDILAFVHSKNTVTVRRLSGALPQVHRLLDELSDQWNRARLSLGLGLGYQDQLLRTTRDSLERLHDCLILPVEDLLDPLADGLLIVPHGPMGAVPFPALFDGGRYLTERWALQMGPTLATAPASDRPIDLDGPALIVAVADAYIPSVRAEAETVGRYATHSVTLVDGDATAARFTGAVPGATLVHLACHGVFQASNPLFSRLRLGDRWLTSAEVVHLDLAGALVVLSACESGAHGRAAEPVGLGWAFLAAGASGVVVSQWPVHDEATLFTMAEFYCGLRSGLPPSYALRVAQMRTADQFPHPYFWAPFSYVTSISSDKKVVS